MHCLFFGLAASVKRLSSLVDQIIHVDGLGQVIVRTDFQADDAVGRFTRTGHHDDADIEMFAQMARQAQPNWSVWW